MGIGWLLLQALYILISAAAVGMGSGLMIAYLLKKLDSLKESAVRQVAILMLGGYLSFRCVLQRGAGPGLAVSDGVARCLRGRLLPRG